ncbi:hypothetical protein HaLaN_12113, partial [Haematococcus lacustris]
MEQVIVIYFASQYFASLVNSRVAIAQRSMDVLACLPQASGFLDMARASEWAEVAVAAVQFNVSVLSSDGQRLLYTSTPSPVEPACNEVADRRNGDCLMRILGGDRAAFLDLLEHTVDGALWQGTVTPNHVAPGLSRSISR